MTIPGFLGVHVRPDAQGRPVVEDVQPDSPADRAGLKVDDLVVRLDGKEVTSADAFRTALHAKAAGDSVQLATMRDGKPLEMSVRSAPVSRPMPASRGQASPLGVQVTAAKGGEGVTIESVQPGSVAERAKLKVGETILKIDDTALNGPEKLREAVRVQEARRHGDTHAFPCGEAGRNETETTGRTAGRGPVRWRRAGRWRSGRRLEPAAGTGPSRPTSSPSSASSTRTSSTTRRSRPRTGKSRCSAQGRTTGRPRTGQKVYGSMNDYYQEQSYGKFKIEGKVVRLGRGEQEADGLQHRAARDTRRC